MAFGELSMLQVTEGAQETVRRGEWMRVLSEAVGQLDEWEDQWPGFEQRLGVDSDDAAEAISKLAGRLEQNLPYFHPLYAGHMLKPPHPVAWAAYALTMLVNPNNQTREVGEATTEMELEVVDRLAKMLGFSDGYLGHLTTSGTIANLEAMWIARETHPDKAIACSKAAHYNYSRIANLLGVRLVSVPTRADETINAQALAEVLAGEDVGTVVVTLGTTGLGVVDPLDEVLEVVREHSRAPSSDTTSGPVRIHVDAAYGGFFALLADGEHPEVDASAFSALGDVDSITIDPHKHGLQPYGCGCILFRDGQVATHYDHDSPYTYLERDSLHMGQIQLECSRSGAAAGALWATLEALPLERDRGLGPLLSSCRNAALGWAQAIDESPCLRLVVPPHLDIVSFGVWPRLNSVVRASDVTRWTERILELGAGDEELPFYLTRYDIDCETAVRFWPDLQADAPSVSVLRSCMMKPEHEAWWITLHSRVSETAWDVLEEE
ncbi:MAG: pyridoxal phosphate-dependent decarboxylase family protein [Persicimonas sp.]